MEKTRVAMRSPGDVSIGLSFFSRNERIDRNHGTGAIRIADVFRGASRRDSPLDLSRLRSLQCTEQSLMLEPSPNLTS